MPPLPATSVINRRRLTSSIGSPPEPAVPAYRTLRLPRKHRQVLGVDLNRLNSGLLPPGDVRVGVMNGPGGMSAQCPDCPRKMG